MSVVECMDGNCESGMTISSPVSLQKARELVVQLIEQKELEVGPQVMLNWCAQGC